MLLTLKSLTKIGYLAISSLSMFLVSCDLLNKAEDLLLANPNSVEKVKTEQKKISISCDRGNIKDYTDNGWKIVSSEEKEMPCSWKSEKSRKGCNIKLDKGCLITVPDRMGKEIDYILEKEIKLN